MSDELRSEVDNSKVLIIGSDLKSLINFRKELIHNYLKKNYRVVVASPGNDVQLVDELKSWGCAYKCIMLERSSLNIISESRCLVSIFRLLLDTKPNILIPYTVKPVLYSLMAGKFVKNIGIFPIITGLGYVFGKEQVLQKLLGFLAVYIYRRVFKVASGVIFQNYDDLALFLRNKIIDKEQATKVVGGSGVDGNYFSQMPIPDRHNFLMVARLLKDKGVIEYCQAAEIVKRKVPSARFRLVGGVDSNPMSLSFEDIEPWVQSGVIEYIGAVKDVRPYLAECRYFVLPSYREGLPRSTLEAMSVGRPIITTNAPGCRETVMIERNGILVPVKDPINLASAMFLLTKEKNEIIEQMGEESRYMVKQNFLVTKVTNDIDEFIFNISGR